MIERVVSYKTSDGKVHDTEIDARTHELRDESLKKIIALLDTSVKTGRIESVIRHMLLEEESVRAILLNYHRRIPQTKKESKAAA